MNLQSLATFIGALIDWATDTTFDDRYGTRTVILVRPHDVDYVSVGTAMTNGRPSVHWNAGPVCGRRTLEVVR